MRSNANLRRLGNALHERLLRRNDILVTAEISETFLPLLANALRNKFPNLPDPHLVETVAIDTLMVYLNEPARYDPNKASLIGYLYMDAYWNLKDILRQEKKSVELQSSAPEYIVSSEIVVDNTEERLIEESSPIVRRVLAEVTDPKDLEIVKLMMEGVRDTAVYAEVLGIQNRPASDQAVIVKQHKDRLKATLRRRIKRGRGRKR